MTAAAHLETDRERAIAANLVDLRRRIAVAAERSGREPQSVRLVGVSKTFSAELCAAAVRAGVTDLGENRVQEGVAKRAALAAIGLRPAWHLIGHLQRNKVGAALAGFDLIESVDSERLALAISERADATRSVLLEVNIAGEASKHGFAPEDVAAVRARIAALPHLEIRGLMTVAPVVEAEAARPYFRELRRLADALGLAECSMGMSNDFETAIEEGATIVRVGRTLFGERRAAGATL